MRQWLAVNIGPQERVARIVVGLVVVVVGTVVLTGAPAAVVAVLAVLLGVARLDLVVTGALAGRVAVPPRPRHLGGHRPARLTRPAATIGKRGQCRCAGTAGQQQT